MDEILHTPNSSGEDILAPAPLPSRILSALEAGSAALRRRSIRIRHKLDEATSGGRRLVSPVNFLAVAAIAGIAAVVCTVYTPSYMVSVDGIPLGTVREPQVFEDVISRVEDRASGILGYDYNLGRAVEYEFALSKRNELSDTDAFENYLFNGIGDIIQSYVLTVDGEFIGAALDEASLTTMLDEIKAAYVTENTISADFVADVSITYQYTPRDIYQDLEAMQALLTENTNGQTTYEVVQGDTFMQIALDNGMTVSEMQELNPDINIDLINIGQLLNIREVIPYLSVMTVDNVTYNEAIECPVEQVEDDSMFQGDSRVIEAGVPGEALINADITYVNGREQERNILTTEVLTEPTTRVIAVGTKVRPSWYPNGYFIWPLYGSITSRFGYRTIFGSTSYHGGIDIAAPYGTSIAAADGGTVVFAGTATGAYWSFGNLVIIDHGNGKQTYYAHCSSILVSVGSHVYQGQTIARVGSTGRTTGNHCHFEVRINGTRVNPLAYLS